MNVPDDGRPPTVAGPGHAGGSARARRRRGLRALFPLFRWLHVYVSMVSFTLILLFAATGITLNHLEWEWVSRETVDTLDGILPETWREGEAVDWLVVVEHLREAHGVGGRVEDRRADDFEASVAFRGPGYAADAFIDPDSGRYELIVARAGAVGILNDLHRGQGGGTGLRILVDVIAVFLLLLSATGIGLLVFLRKFRTSGLLAMAGGTLLAFFLLARWIV